jgi:hypothetical protein
MRTSGLGGRLPVKAPAERFGISFVHEMLTAPAPVPSYPIDVSGGLTAFPMWGNGPDASLTINSGTPVHDCSYAARENYLRITGVDAGVPVTLQTTNQVVAEYLAFSGGDLGACVADAMLTWYKAGTILAFAPVDHTNRGACDSAMSLFHGLYVGCDLTADADALFQQELPWTTANGETPSGDSHCMVKVGTDGTSLDTWACWTGLQHSTLAWTAACVREAWVMVTPADAHLVNLAALRAQIDALGGTGGS